MEPEVCLITGVGPGTGSALVRRFAKSYRVAMLARTEQRLEALATEIPNASSFPCDVSDPAALKESFEQIVRELGAPAVVIHNAVGGAFGDFLAIDPAVLERNFQVNTMALLHLARLAAPPMLQAGKGAILYPLLTVYTGP